MSTFLCKSATVKDRATSFAFKVIKEERIWPAFVIRVEGDLKGYLNVCPHMAYRLDAGRGDFFSKDGKRLICKSHGAMFDPAGGACVAGPCIGFGLIPLELKEEGDSIYFLDGEYTYCD